VYVRETPVLSALRQMRYSCGVKERADKKIKLLEDVSGLIQSRGSKEAYARSESGVSWGSHRDDLEFEGGCFGSAIFVGPRGQFQTASVRFLACQVYSQLIVDWPKLY
jgi:hypothetical protein